MMRSWKLGTAFGIGIYLHWTFFLLPAWVVLATWGIAGPSMIIFLLALLAAVFGCVVLHELGHALMARYFGIPTRDITLYPIGGVARLERMSERPHEELLIALAGPAVNVVIAALLAPVVGMAAIAFGWEALASSGPGSFLLTLLLTNGMLVFFNLLPAFPMDGGRVLRAVLTGPLGRLRATEIATYVSIPVAFLLAIAGVFWLSNPMLILVAAFVFFVGQQELAVLRRREALPREEPVEVLPLADEEAPRPAAPAGPRFTGAIWDARSRVWVLWHDGRPIASYGIPSE